MPATVVMMPLAFTSRTPVISLIPNKQIAGSVHCYTHWIIQRRIDRGSTIAIKGIGAIARHRRNDAVGVHLADTVISPIRNKQIAGSVHCYALWIIQRRIGRGSPVTGKGIGIGAIASHRRNDAVGIYLADTAKLLIRNKQIAGSVHGYALWIAQRRIDRGSTIAIKGIGSIARHRRNDTS